MTHGLTIDASITHTGSETYTFQATANADLTNTKSNDDGDAQSAGLAPLRMCPVYTPV